MGGLLAEDSLHLRHDDSRHLALTAFLSPPVIFPRSIIEAAYASNRGAPITGFLLTTVRWPHLLLFVAAGLLTFLDAALAQKDTARGTIMPRRTMPRTIIEAHGHAALDTRRMGMRVTRSIRMNPLPMLIPLAFWLAGALFAGLLFSHNFIGEGAVNFGKARCFLEPGNEALEAREAIPGFTNSSHAVDGLRIFSSRRSFIFWRRRFPVRLAQALKPLYEFLLTNGTFDELYDLIFVRAGLFGSAACSGRAAMVPS